MSATDPGRSAFVAGLEEVLSRRPAEPIPESECASRAAVTLLLRCSSAPGHEPEALFVLRARVAGDPWSGHVALPGGRWEQGDADILDTARRETLEETGLRLGRGEYLGRLREIHPRSPHLPAICVTPFVAWLAGEQEVTLNEELVEHMWVPVRALIAPENRTTLVRQAPRRREFAAIRHGRHLIWGLTFAILEDFLATAAGAIRAISTKDGS